MPVWKRTLRRLTRLQPERDCVFRQKDVGPDHLLQRRSHVPPALHGREQQSEGLGNQAFHQETRISRPVFQGPRDPRLAPGHRPILGRGAREADTHHRGGEVLTLALNPGPIAHVA